MKKQYVLTQEEFSQLETIRDVIIEKMFAYDDKELHKAENALTSILYGTFDKDKNGFEFELSK